MLDTAMDFHGISWQGVCLAVDQIWDPLAEQRAGNSHENAEADIKLYGLA